MNGFFFLALLTAFATLGVLITGVITMLKGGEFNKKYGNKLMRMRVAFQGLTIILLLLLAITASK